MTVPLRLGVVGCGRVFERFHLPALRETPVWQLRAVSDPNPDRRRWAIEVSPEITAYESTRQMLDQEELDAVLVAAPPEQHAKLAAQVVEGGVHALIEKPGGRNAADAERIAQAAAQSDRVLWVGFNRRFSPNYIAIRELFAANPGPTDAVFKFAVSFSVADWNAISGYLADGERGGDVVRDLASHQLDLLGWMFDSSVTAIRCHARHHPRRGIERLEYEARLSNGSTVHCVAEHGERYGESLWGSSGGVRALLYPTGLLRSRIVNFRPLRLWANLRYWFDRKLIRAGVMRNPLQLSFRNQLAAFASRIQGEHPAVEGASAQSALMTQRAMDLLVLGNQSLGKWQVLESIPSEGAGRMPSHLTSDLGSWEH